jgi:hypothetical protein
MNSKIPNNSSTLFALILTKFVNLGTAIINANNIYQDPSICVAVMTIINLLSKSDATFKNWLNMAK